MTNILNLIDSLLEDLDIQYEISADQKDNKLSIKINVNDEDLQQDPLNKAISDYMENIDCLDDCVFVSAIEKAAEIIDIKEFNTLISKNAPYTDNEKNTILKDIQIVNKIITQEIERTIDELKKALIYFKGIGE